jgi:hypothetical protein
MNSISRNDRVGKESWIPDDSGLESSQGGAGHMNIHDNMYHPRRYNSKWLLHGTQSEGFAIIIGIGEITLLLTLSRRVATHEIVRMVVAVDTIPV